LYFAGEGCTEKPVGTLWRNYCSSSRSDVAMTLTVGGGGLRALTKEHGLTEYWAHRVTFCAAPPAFPRVFCWVYRHEGRRLKQELRCHAVLCAKVRTAHAHYISAHAPSFQ
jgi:Phosphotyrosine interaction domain (PTB/PID)